MKTAYELAMERLAESDPDAVQSLSEEQRQKLRELDEAYRTKIAEKEVFLQEKLDKADPGSTDAEQLERQKRDERARLEEECEAEKEKVRRGETS